MAVSRTSALPAVQLISPFSSSPSGYVGLLVLARVGGELRYRGWRGMGVRRDLDALKQGAQLRGESPFVDLQRWWRDVTWLEPRLIAESAMRSHRGVSYAEIVGGCLRAAVYRGLLAPRGASASSAAHAPKEVSHEGSRHDTDHPWRSRRRLRR
jgi:hypothetical protein